MPLWYATTSPCQRLSERSAQTATELCERSAATSTPNTTGASGARRESGSVPAAHEPSGNGETDDAVIHWHRSSMRKSSSGSVAQSVAMVDSSRKP